MVLILSEASTNITQQKPLFVYNGNTTYGLGILILTIFAAAIVRFITVCTAHKKSRPA